MTSANAKEAPATYGVDLLAFGPHPDDVELFCGGLLARSAALGYRTAIVDLTRGEKSSRGDPQTRQQEAEEGARVLGVASRENLELPDGGLSGDLPVELGRAREPGERSPVARVVEVLRRLRPEIVVAPWHKERHPDHEAASAIVTRALFYAGVRRWPDGDGDDAFSPRQVLYYPMRHVAEPSFIVDVTASYEKKTAAIACYRSQVEPRQGEPSTLVSSPLSLSSLEARDRFYGAHIGVEHGEPYLIREVLGLEDAVAHFRRNSFARPLVFPERS